MRYNYLPRIAIQTNKNVGMHRDYMYAAVRVVAEGQTLYPVYTMKLARRAGSMFARCWLHVGYALCMLYICSMFALRLLDDCLIV